MAPAAPPGLGAAEEASATAGHADLQREIAVAIDAQVGRLLMQARTETETKVKVELKQIIDVMMAMDRQLDGLIAQLDAIDPQDHQADAQNAAGVSRDTVGQVLQKVEQQWGQEIKTLKQELHQTILAHNHNADLIKHHKDTLDQLQERSLLMSGNNGKTAEIQAQLQRLDARLKQQQKQKKLEPLFERLQLLEQCVFRAGQQSAYTAGFARMGAFPPAMPGMLGPPGMLGAAGMAGLVGGAPGMGAPGLGLAAPPAKKGGAPAPGLGAAAAPAPKAATRPTDEQIQAAAQLPKAVVKDAAVAGFEAAPKAETAEADAA